MWPTNETNETSKGVLILSEEALSDWNKPEENEAWESLQKTEGNKKLLSEYKLR